MLQHCKGNLIDLAISGKFDIIVHGCNCFNTMGGGIAREIKQRMPAAYAEDCKTVQGDYNKLGNYTTAFVNNVLVVNAYTQYSYSTREQDLFEYTAFSLILQKICHEFPGRNLGLPYIGMGLASGNPDTILDIIDDFAEKYTAGGTGTVTLVEFAK